MRFKQPTSAPVCNSSRISDEFVKTDLRTIFKQQIRPSVQTGNPAILVWCGECVVVDSAPQLLRHNVSLTRSVTYQSLTLIPDCGELIHCQSLHCCLISRGAFNMVSIFRVSCSRPESYTDPLWYTAV
ncbi:hypothetical protein RRG08_017059 [Elysia crispata]|uniref:Uncharacterized protein n=1 Tax=Elysia crispata TaxID=231223 RepID=A0AAE0ZAP4_9GAST|nr:hypothetical protein RRG08_017059 [Elysia crispata]